MVIGCSLLQTFLRFEDEYNLQASLPPHPGPVSKKPSSRCSSFGKSKSCNDLESIPPAPSAVAVALSNMAA